MLRYNTDHEWESRLYTARRVFMLVPIVVFLMTLMVLATSVPQSYTHFLSIVLQSIAVSLTSSVVSIAAYGFYRYLNERSPGL